MLTIEFDHLEATRATVIDDQTELTTFRPHYRMSSTEVINESLLAEKVQQLLHSLEHQTNIRSDEIKALEVLISNLPGHSSLREDAKYRINQIQELADLQSELTVLSTTLNACGMDNVLARQFYTLQGKVQACLNSPLKQHLLSVMKGITLDYSLNTIPHSEADTVQTCHSAVEALDDQLIGLMIAEYINLPTEHRLKLATELCHQLDTGTLGVPELIAAVKQLAPSYATLAITEPENEETEYAINNSLIITDTLDDVEIVDGQIRLKDN